MAARRPQPVVKKSGGKNAGQIAARRFAVVLAIFALWAIGIGARLAFLQINQHDALQLKAVEQRQRERKTKPLRGSILDRKGRELAITLEVESLWIDPSEIENAEAAAYRLAPALGEKPKELLTQINEAKEAKKRFIYLARELEKETVQRVKELNVPGLRWQKEQKRYYPHGKLAAQVVGFASREDVGQAGIELTQDKNLRGELGEITEARDGKGRVYEVAENVTQAPRDVVLTIDYAVQYRVEQALAAGVREAHAKSGTAVVINPSTGEILAMATVPTFDPNEPGEAKPEILSNKSVQTLYEPGSTFKLVAYAAGLNENLIRPNDTIDASAGFVKIGNRRIPDSHPTRGAMTLTEALAKSSNVAAITIGQRVGKNKLYEYVQQFGYGAATGVELPAETRGMLSPPEKWRADSIGSISIGYEVGVTTLQSASAYSAIANDGVRIAPHIVKEVREENGNLFAQTAPENRRVVSRTTAATMREMLESVTVKGTGKLAQVAGYSAAGKTGTAHKFDAKAKKYSNNYVASFVGFAPAEKPAVVIAVMIDEPASGSHFGGDVAAPIFSDIAEQILPELEIAPDEAAPDVFVAQSEKPQITATKATLQTADEKTAKLEKQAIDENKPKTTEKTVEKTQPKGDLKANEKTKAAAQVAPQKVSPKAETKLQVLADEPRPRVVVDKKSLTAKPQNAPQKAKNESPPKGADRKKGSKT